ncbi:asparagine synthetase B [Polaribacter sp. ALD11]|uniref:DUF2911 domain-containing protein n=1 Tax=Polaribacter sp. ALD11 TaxID=2058137 RepID=UPI000C314BA0|nr:DUF2911 domain-containing protein [Polaribacter sp. ALD11]AUC85918.1 asparagine synthetase B [Polaribacter sp. ALD11]
MKKSILAIAIFAITLISSTDTFAQKWKKLDVSPMDASTFPDNWRESNKVLKVVYGRPQLKGRDLDKLAPIDKVWRTGANEAAEITFYKDVVFGGKEVKAGSYSLFTIPVAEGDWTVILSTAKNVWGHYTYKQEEDVVRVSGVVSNSDESIEAFSMMFDEDMTLKMGWANTVVSVPISAETSED